MNIYLTFDREKKLREFAETKGVTISVLIQDFIDSLDAPKSFKDELPDHVFEEKQLKPMCERPFCKQRSEGRYRIVTDGVDEVVQNLCMFHWNGARKEGEVYEA